MAKLVGESHGCERGLAAVGVPAVRRTSIETGARTESAASITAAVSVPFLEMRALALLSFPLGWELVQIEQETAWVPQSMAACL